MGTYQILHRRALRMVLMLTPLLLILGAVAGCAPLPLESQPVAIEEQNKEVVQQMLENVFSGGDMDAIDEVIAPDFIEHEELPPGMPAGREGIKASIAMMHAAFPDFTVTIDDMIAEGDRVAVRLTWSGTQDGEFMGMPPTGKSFSMNVFDIFRMEGGQVVEHWGLSDTMAMMTQLGMMPAPEMGDVPQTETYVDENGLFTAEYPAGWVVDPYGFGDEDPTPHVNFGSQQEILELSMASEPLPEDQIGMSVILLHRDMVAEQGITAETPLEDIAQLVMASMAPEEAQEGMSEATIESITLENGTPAVRITTAAPSEAYVIHLVDMGDGVILLAPQILALGYENAELEAQVEAIINSVDLTASGEEVMAFIMSKMGEIAPE